MKRLKQYINNLNASERLEMWLSIAQTLSRMKGILGTLLFGAALAASNPEAATIGRGTGKTMKMKLCKSLIITALCLVAFAATAQTQQQFIDTKCAELANDEFRAEMELKRIRTERAKLNASKMELQINLYNKQLTDLELKKAGDVAKIEAEYLRAKGEIASKMTVATSVVSQPTCAQ